MATLLFSNDAGATLAGAISSVATTLTLAAGTGILFPNPGAGELFKLTLTDAATGVIKEIVHCTSRSGDVCTIVRAQEGTTARAWLAGDLVDHLWTAGSAQAMVQAVAFYPARIVTVSGVFVMTTSDYAVGLQRVASPAVSSTSLPSGTAVGQEYEIADLTSNFQAYPVTISPPAGHNIANLSSVVLNINRTVARFRYFGSNTWSFDI